MKQFFMACAISSLSLPAIAEPVLSIPLPVTEESSLIPVEYECETNEKIRVTYVNAGENRLAVIPVDGTDMVFANVIAASGARYVAQQFEWWNKGDEATLTNLMDDSSQTCSAKG